VYIGRGSKWGNPFVIGKDGDRAEVIEQYKRWLLGIITIPDRVRPTTKEADQELLGKVLGCHCSPEACHGDVLVAFVAHNISF